MALTRPSVRLLQGDALEVLRGLPDESVQTCVTSPPYYGLRDYGVGGQYGLEPTVEEYVARMVEVFAEVRRVLRSDGTCWLNLGDSYANDGKWGGTTGGKHAAGLHGDSGIGRRRVDTGLKPKDLIGIPWRVAFALQADGWWLRSDIVWAKPNPMPESVTDRPTKAHEYLFLLAKAERYFYDADAIRELAHRGSESAPAGWNTGPGSHNTRDGRYKSGNKERRVASSGEGDRLNTHMGYSFPWEDDGRGRNARTVWTIATQPFPEAHFATFPEELVQRCVLAGCPEAVCAKCGTPRSRLARTEYANPGNRTTNGPRSVANRGETAGFAQRLEAVRETTGWSDCGCGTGWVVGTVLDPFIGSGTTAMVAARLGRNAIGVDLNPEYLAMAERRVAPYTAQAKFDLTEVSG